MKNLFVVLLIACSFLFTGSIAADHSNFDDGPPIEQSFDVSVDYGVEALESDVLTFSMDHSVDLSHEVNLSIESFVYSDSYCSNDNTDASNVLGRNQQTINSVVFKTYPLRNYPYKKGFSNHYSKYRSIVIQLV